MMEEVLDRNGDHDLVEKGQSYEVDNSKFLELIGPSRKSTYEHQDLLRTLSKYYAERR